MARRDQGTLSAVRISLRTVLGLLCAACLPAAAPAAPPSPSATLLESGHAPVNGIRMYYEVHGRRGGIPLVLLHGGGSTIGATFGKVLPSTKAPTAWGERADG